MSRPRWVSALVTVSAGIMTTLSLTAGVEGCLALLGGTGDAQVEAEIDASAQTLIALPCRRQSGSANRAAGQADVYDKHLGEPQ